MAKKLFFLLSLAIFFASCDEGPIEPKSFDYGQETSVRLNAHIIGLEQWKNSDNQMLALAGFGDGPYAKISKNIVPDAGGNVDITLSGTSLSGVKTIEICLLGTLRDRIYTFESREIAQGENNMLIELGDFDVSPFGAVEKNIFSPTCAQCHGLSTSAARGVNLTKEKLNIVNKPSANLPEMMIVQPGNHDNSLLYKMFTSDITSNWRVDHKTFVQEENLIKAIELWIDNAE